MFGIERHGAAGGRHIVAVKARGFCFIWTHAMNDKDEYEKTPYGYCAKRLCRANGLGRATVFVFDTA